VRYCCLLERTKSTFDATESFKRISDRISIWVCGLCIYSCVDCDLVVVCVASCGWSCLWWILRICSVWYSFRVTVSVSGSLVNGSGTSVGCVNGRTDSKLVGSDVLSCWLQVSCELAELICVRVPFVESKQQNRKTEEGVSDTSQFKLCEGCYAASLWKMLWLCLSDSYSHTRTAPPAAKPQGVIGAPHWGAWLDCSTHVWASDGGPTMNAASLLMGRSPKGTKGRAAWWSIFLNYQLTEWAVDFFEEMEGWRLRVGQLRRKRTKTTRGCTK